MQCTHSAIGRIVVKEGDKQVRRNQWHRNTRAALEAENDVHVISCIVWGRVFSMDSSQREYRRSNSSLWPLSE
ncbi:hypothetical protein VTO42DRAFT_5514 [Malbranchea cinnamomea]